MKQPPGDRSKAQFWSQVGGPLLALGVAAAVELLSRGPFKIPNPPAFLLLVVVFSAFIGGVRSGLITALIAWLYFAYFFSMPGQPLLYTTENLRRVIVWAVTTPIMALLVGILQHRAERAFESSKENAVLIDQIAERQRAEQALKQREASHAALLSGSLDGIITIDREGRILEFNPAAEATFAYRRDEVLGRELAELIIPAGLRDRHRRGLAHYLATGESPILNKRIEINAIRSTGEEFPVELTVIRDPSSNPPVFTGFVRDITARKQAEREIRTLNKELEERVRQRTAQLEAANQELEAFAYSAAHDLRAPLITIAGFSRMIIEDHASSLPDEAQRYLHEVDRSVRKMSTLIDDLLTLSRLGRQPIKEQPVSLADVARQVLAELNGARAGRAASVRIGDLPLCRVDPALIKQVLANLLSNALKFSRRREDAVIEVGWRRDLDDPTHRAYFVKDNGAGFDMRYADKLFRVFQRLHRTEDYEGTGIGLAIVHRIVQRHGGRVWAEGEPEKGAAFYFTLPRSDAA